MRRIVVPATRAYAQRVDEMTKFVVSRSGTTARWVNSSVVESLDKDAVTALKDGGHGDLVVYGSLSVITALGAIDMIDEYHLLVHPTAIGKGKALFPADQAHPPTSTCSRPKPSPRASP